VLARWKARDGVERERSRTAQSFCVSKVEIAATGSYDLSVNRYKEAEHEEHTHRAPLDIILELRDLEEAISGGLTVLEGMMG